MFLERHIGSCNDTSFEQLIRKQTRGRGVDIIINTLLEEKQTASLRCLAKRGTFFEIGTQNLAQNRPLPLELMKKDSVFHAICLDQIIEASTKRKQSLIKIIQDGINRGAVQTLEMNLFNDNEVEMAFKRIADKENIGKVAIKIRQEEDDDMEAIPIPKFLPSIPRSEILLYKTFFVRPHSLLLYLLLIVLYYYLHKQLRLTKMTQN